MSKQVKRRPVFVAERTKPRTRPAPAGSVAGTEQPRIRLRVLANSVIAIGPGKADLLEAIASTGSISAAAREMGMSYRRAWLLVDTMNTCFCAPLVSTAKGGAEGGGASLTPTGRKVLDEYRSISEMVVRRFGALLHTSTPTR